jgi:hypothetical protein
MALTGNDKLLQTYWRDDILRGIPISARAYRTSNLAVTGPGWNTLSFQAVRWDDNAGTPMWAVGSPTRMTAQIPGTYNITFNGEITDSTAGGQVFLRLSTGSVIIAAVTWTGPRMLISTMYKLAAGEYIEVLCYPAGNMTFGSAAAYQCEVTMAKVA